jgi:hypothetical protein
MLLFERRESTYCYGTDPVEWFLWRYSADRLLESGTLRLNGLRGLSLIGTFPQLRDAKRNALRILSEGPVA